MCGRGRQGVDFPRVVLQVEQHFGRMRIEGQCPFGMSIVSSQYQFIPGLVRRHSPLVVIAQGKLAVRKVTADVFVASVADGTYRHEVVQLVGRDGKVELPFPVVGIFPEQRLSLHLPGRFDSCQTQYRRSQVGEVHQVADLSLQVSCQVLPLGREVHNQRHSQSAFVQIPLAARNTATVVAEEENDGILIQSLFLQVGQEESEPLVDVLHGFQMSGIVGTYLRQVGYVARQGELLRIDTLLRIVAAAVGVEGPDAAHVRSHCVEHGKERLVLSPLRTAVAGFLVALVPATFVVGRRIIMCLAVVGTVITCLAQPLREEDIRRSIIRYGVHIHSPGRGIASGNQ